MFHVYIKWVPCFVEKTQNKWFCIYICYLRIANAICDVIETRPQGYKTFFMLSSAEITLYPAYKSRIDYRFCRSEPEISIYLGYFVIYEQFQFYVVLYALLS